MPYSTPALVRKALIPDSDGTQPTEPSFTAADLSDQQLADAIAEADTYIDSYLSRFYTVPVALVEGATPHPIDYWSRNIAAYNATLSYTAAQPMDADHPVRIRYNGTVEALKAVSTGAAGLNLPHNVTDSMAAGAEAPINPYTGTLFLAEDFDLSAGGNPYMPRPYWNGQGW
jgi:phage gp36-like protein